jgi:O-antigen/teichoic acid export membrane protein
MSRLKRYTWSILSSYALMGTNVVYTLVSMPLALTYLSKAEFGLWALTLQVANYIALIDLGMGSSVSRILIDHKDHRGDGRYGGAIQSGFLVGLAQGGVSLIVGLSIVWVLGSWLNVPVELRPSFFWLMIGQVCLTAAVFTTRLLSQILFAWQRIDVGNYSAMVHLLVGLGTLWISFHLGCGVYSLTIGAVAGWLVSTAINFVQCRRLGMLPVRGEWGHVSWAQFLELFRYGADVFLIGLGTQLIMSSQVVLITRHLGLDAATLWSVMTKMFSLVSQALWRFVGNAMPAFAEMHVRREQKRLWDRYRALFITLNVMAGVCAVIFAACNAPFVTIWMHGKFSWPRVNDILLAVWLVILTQQCCHNSLIVAVKQIKGLKYAYFVEGILFVCAAVVFLPRYGMTGMLACSIAATFLCTYLAGAWQLSRIMGHRLSELLWVWQGPLAKILVVLVPLWAAAEWIFRGFGPSVRLLVMGIVLGLGGAWLSIAFALPENFVNEFGKRLPGYLQRFFRYISRSNFITLDQRPNPKSSE